MWRKNYGNGDRSPHPSFFMSCMHALKRLRSNIMMKSLFKKLFGKKPSLPEEAVKEEKKIGLCERCINLEPENKCAEGYLVMPFEKGVCVAFVEKRRQSNEA